MAAELTELNAQHTYSDDQSRWDAVIARDSAADGYFWFSVSTTGVYCYPSCAARRPKRENVGFHDDREAAERAGFRPCKRCRPDLPPRRIRDAEAIAHACRLIESAEQPPPLVALAEARGAEPTLFPPPLQGAGGRHAQAVRDRASCTARSPRPQQWIVGDGRDLQLRVQLIGALLRALEGNARHEAERLFQGRNGGVDSLGCSEELAGIGFGSWHRARYLRDTLRGEP